MSDKKLVDLRNVTCRISLCIFLDPVIASDGFTYEKQQILKHRKNSNISPATGKVLENNILIH